MTDNLASPGAKGLQVPEVGDIPGGEQRISDDDSFQDRTTLKVKSAGTVGGDGTAGIVREENARNNEAEIEAPSSTTESAGLSKNCENPEKEPETVEQDRNLDVGEIQASTRDFAATANLPPSASTGPPKPPDLISQNFEGPCRFGFIFPAMENQGVHSFHVSELMNKVYLKMGQMIVIKFTLDPTGAPTTDLYVRATMKYCCMDIVQLPVDRCTLHWIEDDPYNKSHEFEHLCKCAYYNLAGHVLRSQTQGAIYCYDPLSRRHSVLSPLKARSHDVVYSFHCKSSCSKGIERRPTHVVFTLEMMNGFVLGQTSLNIKICTSPKRDKIRNETEFHNRGAKRKRIFFQSTEQPASDSDTETAALPANPNSQNMDAMVTALQTVRQHLLITERLVGKILQLAGKPKKSAKENEVGKK